MVRLSMKQLFRALYGIGGSLMIASLWRQHDHLTRRETLLMSSSTQAWGPSTWLREAAAFDSHKVEQDVMRNKQQQQQQQQPKKKIPLDPLSACDENPSLQTCCVPWHVDTDDWWAHRVQWLTSGSHDNATHQCFDRVSNATLLQALRQVYQNQWNAAVCNNSYQRLQLSSGYGASFSVHAGMMTKVVDTIGRPYVMTKHKAEYRWLYATKDNTSWAWCPSFDINCYLVPYVICAQNISNYQANRITKGKPVDFHQPLAWAVRRYLSRYRTAVRYRIQQLIDSWPRLLLSSPSSSPCTVMHVRRGDAGSVRARRRYVPLSEYLEIANLTKADPIVLLTDDQSTLEEIEKFYADYNWWYPPRRRVRAMELGFDGHTPNSPEHDFVTMLAELQVAGRCNRLVHGDSGFTRLVHWAMQDGDSAVEIGRNPTMYHVVTEIPKNQMRTVKGNGNQFAEQMLKEIEDKNAARLGSR